MQVNLSDLPDTARRELIMASRNGDGSSFEILCASFKPWIYKYIMSLNVPASERDDLFQEGLIGLLKAVRSYDYESSSFSTYASVCIKRSIISALRKLNRNSQFELSADPSTVLPQNLWGKSPELDIVEHERYASFVNDLSPFEKRTFRMYMCGASYSRMAEELSCSVKSIDNAITRIKAKLKRRMKQDNTPL
jgi:RNA polymerase sigma factor, sigma-70 family